MVVTKIGKSMVVSLSGSVISLFQVTRNSNNVQTDSGSEHFTPKYNSTMDIDGSVKDGQDGSGSNSPYDNIPVGLLKCTICESTMTDGPVRICI